MTTATYTLKSNGLVVVNQTEIQSGQWWSRSPTPVEGVGNSFEAMATIITNSESTLTGVFDEWVSISNDLTWSSSSDEETQTEILIQIKGVGSEDVAGSSRVTMNTAQPSLSFVELVTALQPITWVRLNETSGTVALDSGTEGADLIYTEDCEESDIAPSSAFTGAGARAKSFTSNIGVYSDEGVGTVSGSNVTIALAMKVFSSPGSAIFNATNAAQVTIFEEFGFLSFQVATAENTKQTVGSGPSTTPYLDEWAYYCFTYDESTLRVKVNDVLVFSVNNPITMFSPAGAEFNLGASELFSSVTEIDEFQIYDKILTDEEQTLNYNAWATG